MVLLIANFFIKGLGLALAAKSRPDQPQASSEKVNLDVRRFRIPLYLNISTCCIFIFDKMVLIFRDRVTQEEAIFLPLFFLNITTRFYSSGRYELPGRP